MLAEYFKKTGSRRILIMILGNVFLGMGVSIFKLAGLGNDAYNGMVMALSDCVRVPYEHFFVVFSLCLFVIELLAGRHFVGIGTIVNTFLLGYVVTFFYELWLKFFQAPQILWQQLLVVLLGVIVGSLGLSMYQVPDAGVAPYDSLSLILAKRFPKIPYFWCRMLTDGTCALVCFLAGGLVGVGTLVAAFGFGPFIHFCHEHLTKKLLKGCPGFE